MAIDPLRANPNTVAQPDDKQVRAARTSSAETKAAETEHGSASTDTVELSSASQQLSGQTGLGASPPSGTLSADRMQAILGRLSSGHYDRSDVQDAIAKGVSKDMGSVSE